MYIEHGSKNESGGLAQLRHENKCVPCYAVPESSPQCLVHLLDLYLNRLPPYAFHKNVFYCSPKPSAPANDKMPWYECIPVGKNKLSSMVKDMCVESGIEIKTNHSLRATGASALFQSKVPEKIIQSTTGHHSLDALRMYEKTSIEQHQAVSTVLMPTQPTSFEHHVSHERPSALQAKEASCYWCEKCVRKLNQLHHW